MNDAQSIEPRIMEKHMHNDEQAIRQLVSTWLNATRAGNTEQVLKLMSDDVVFLTPDRPPMRKSDFVASQAAQQNFDIQGDSEIQEIKLLGDEWAYCWNKLSIVITPRDGGAPTKRAGNVLSILHKQAGSWVIVRDANMLTLAS
jgi:uncharacterized protein (TIGR02246 family)